MIALNVDDLAQEIRRVDGKHSLGAAALAEALMPFLLSREAEQEAKTGSMRHDVEDVVMVACGQCQGIGCDFCDGFGHFNKRAPNLEERDRIEAAITADYENDLRDMTDDEIASEIVSAQNAIDEHEPWLEALVTRQTQRARQKEADHG